MGFFSCIMKFTVPVLNQVLKHTRFASNTGQFPSVPAISGKKHVKLINFFFLRTTEIYWSVEEVWWQGLPDWVSDLSGQHGGWCWRYWLLSLTKRGEKIKMQTKTKRNLARKCEVWSGGGGKNKRKKSRKAKEEIKRKMRSSHKNKNKK